MPRAKREDPLEEARLRAVELEGQLLNMRAELLKVMDYAERGVDVAELMPRLRRVVGGAYQERWSQETILAAYHRWTQQTGKPPSVDDWNPASRQRKLTAEQIAFFYGGQYPTYGAVRGHFGTFNNMVIAAGGEPRAADGSSHDAGGGGQPFGAMPEWHGWQYLAQYRARAGLTQLQVGEAAGIHYRSYAGLERGVDGYVNPQIRTLLAVAKALGVPAVALVE